MNNMEQGRILKVRGHRLQSLGPLCRIGDLVIAQTADGRFVRCLAEGFDGGHIHLLALDETSGLGYGDPLYSTGRPVSLSVGPGLRGCLLDGFGQRVEGTVMMSRATYPTMMPRIQRRLPLPLVRKFHTGVRSIDALLTLAIGQRVLFQSFSSCPSLLQKTTSMMARYGGAQTVVFGLIGLKQREIRNLTSLLDTTASSRCVIFSAPSEASAGERFHCAYAATTAAEYFRDQGEDVLLVLDSLEQWQRAYCELSLLSPKQAGLMLRGATLAQLIERAGRRPVGSITGVYCVRGAGGDLSREVGDLVEGRVLFTRDMESLGVYPPIDVLNSHSDPSARLVSLEQRQLVSGFQGVLRYFKKHQQLIRMGALFEGLSEEGDRTLETVQRCWHFLRQGLHEASSEHDSLERLAECVG
jgi:flagellar biosynthesis/type III secretory pathway ATPase